MLLGDLILILPEVRGQSPSLEGSRNMADFLSFLALSFHAGFQDHRWVLVTKARDVEGKTMVKDQPLGVVSKPEIGPGSSSCRPGYLAPELPALPRLAKRTISTRA
jgi:hypothetical protein